MKEHNELKLNKEDVIFIHNNIENDLQRVYNHFRKLELENKYLKEENERLKSESYKDEELFKMKIDYDRMKEDYFRGFPINKEEDEKIKEWMKTLPKANIGAIGGRFTYKFTSTSIGSIGVVEDSVTGEKLTFRELS